MHLPHWYNEINRPSNDYRHSLGAHIVGAIGRYYNVLTSTLLPRITGLDPASPCFNEGENLNSLSRGDAAYVDVIHSNSGVLGKKEPVGDADYYPNGWVKWQKRRPVESVTLNSIVFSIASIHCRPAVWRLFAPTLEPGNFMRNLCTRAIRTLFWPQNAIRLRRWTVENVRENALPWAMRVRLELREITFWTQNRRDRSENMHWENRKLFAQSALIRRHDVDFCFGDFHSNVRPQATTNYYDKIQFRISITRKWKSF